ncbi:MAG TPA: HgcAB-associated protein [Methanomassiliicoccales archaeon]|nr:HgcAB-associated protein [Methanomassiliicoccales archaeon]
MSTTKSESCCSKPEVSQYRIESLVSIDDRGQMVLPKEIREKLGVRPGDKLAVALSYKGNKVCCAHIFKAIELAGKVKEVVEPEE